MSKLSTLCIMGKLDCVNGGHKLSCVALAGPFVFSKFDFFFFSVPFSPFLWR